MPRSSAAAGVLKTSSSARGASSGVMASCAAAQTPAMPEAAFAERAPTARSDRGTMLAVLEPCNHVPMRTAPSSSPEPNSREAWSSTAAMVSAATCMALPMAWMSEQLSVAVGTAARVAEATTASLVTFCATSNRWVR